MAALLTSYAVHFYSIPYLGVKCTLISATGLSYSCQWLGRGVPRYMESLRSGDKLIGWKDNGYLDRVTMRLKLMENFDGSFQLEPQSDKKLRRLLSSQTFCNQVAQNSGIDGAPAFEFTGELFQPVPWSTNTTHGMPQEFEKYLDRNNYIIINVPPNFMSQAKIFAPSAICAVYKRVSLPDIANS